MKNPKLLAPGSKPPQTGLDSRAGWGQHNGQKGCGKGYDRVSEPLIVHIVGSPSQDSDRAVGRFLERFLEREQDGIRWHVVTPRAKVERPRRRRVAPRRIKVPA